MQLPDRASSLVDQIHLKTGAPEATDNTMLLFYQRGIKELFWELENVFQD